MTYFVLTEHMDAKERTVFDRKLAAKPGRTGGVSTGTRELMGVMGALAPKAPKPERVP